MCKINCSGGCPECSPKDHLPTCTHQYMPGISNCTCGDAWKGTVLGSLPPTGSDYKLMEQRKNKDKKVGIKTPRGSRYLP